MKKGILIFLILINHLLIFSQNNIKYKLGVGLNIQRTFIENLMINDPGLMIKNVKQPFGFTLTIFNFKYYLSKKFSIETSLDLFSFQGVRYFYYGSSYKSSTALPQINLGTSFNLTKHYSFYIGSTYTINPASQFSTTTDKTLFTPKNSVKREAFSGHFFLPEIKLIYTKKTKKNKEVDLFISFTKGFKKILGFTQQTYSPNSTSSFVYNGTRLKVGLNWYFKIK